MIHYASKIIFGPGIAIDDILYIVSERNENGDKKGVEYILDNDSPYIIDNDSAWGEYSSCFTSNLKYSGNDENINLITAAEKYLNDAENFEEEFRNALKNWGGHVEGESSSWYGGFLCSDVKNEIAGWDEDKGVLDRLADEFVDDKTYGNDDYAVESTLIDWQQRKVILQTSKYYPLGQNKSSEGRLFDKLPKLEIDQDKLENGPQNGIDEALIGKGIEGLKFVVTGDIEAFPDRDDFKKYIEEHGGKLIGSVSSKTDYLITNTPDSGTVKNQKARELGIKIINEKQFFDMIKKD